LSGQRGCIYVASAEINDDMALLSKKNTKIGYQRRHSLGSFDRPLSVSHVAQRPFASTPSPARASSVQHTTNIATKLTSSIRVPLAKLSTDRKQETPPLVIPPLFSLQPFQKKDTRPVNLEKKAVPYSGTVTVGAKNVSIVPTTQLTSQVIQFAHSDVLYFEDVVTLADHAGRSVPITRLWVKKGAKGVIVSSFTVGEAFQPGRV
jgi:hypothetical protein